LKSKFQKEQKQLYTQYYNDVYKLTEQSQDLTSYIEQLTDTLKQTEAKQAKWWAYYDARQAEKVGA
jgi:hypothetical protein